MHSQSRMGVIIIAPLKPVGNDFETISGKASDAGTYAVIANHTTSNPGFVVTTYTVVKL